METMITIIIYLGLAGIMAVLADIMFRVRDRGLRNVLWVLLLVLPSLLAAFRGETGTDSAMYRNSYEDIRAMLARRNMEGGYVWIMRGLNACHFSYHMLFFVMGLLTVLFVLLFLQREKKYINIKTAVFLFMVDLYISSFNMMRQALAVAMVLYAFAVFMDGKYIRGAAIVLAAGFIHASALLGLAVAAGKFLFERRYAKAIMLACFGVMVYFICHRELLGEIAFFISRSRYYANYITRDAEGGGSVIGYFIKRMPVIVLSLLYIVNYGRNRRYTVYFGMMAGGYLMAVLGVITATQVQRIGFYFIYLNIAVLAFCANHDLVVNRIRIKRQVTQFLVLCYSVLVFMEEYVYRGFSEVIPYQGLFKV